MHPMQSVSHMRMNLSEMEFSEWEYLERRYRHKTSSLLRDMRPNKQTRRN